MKASMKLYFQIIHYVLVFIFIKNLFKLLLVFVLSLVLFVSLFPKNELSDFVSKTVAEQTNNRIKLDFENDEIITNPKVARLRLM